MAAQILSPGVRLAHNASGANLALRGHLQPPFCRKARSWGCSRSTRPRCPRSRSASRPRAVCLGNLFRDQLDRYGELEHVAERWRAVVRESAGGGGARRERRRSAGRRSRHGSAPERLVFGLDDPRHAVPELQHAADSKWCLRCGRPYEYAAAYVGPSRGLPLPCLRPRTAAARRRGARRIELRGLDGVDFSLAAPRRESGRVGSPCPGSTTSTTLWPPRRSRSRSGRRSTTSRSPVSSGSVPRSGASSGSRSGTSGCSCCS